MSPDAKWLALGVGDSTVISEPGKPAITVLALEKTLRRRTLSAFAAEVKRHRKAEEANPSKPVGERTEDLCRTAPLGWHEGKLEVEQQSTSQDVGSFECPLSSKLFTFDPVKRVREAIPNYPWQVLECPQGGWTSKHGTFVTSCLTGDQLVRRAMKKTASIEGDELPEAVAISETEIFVIAPKKKTEYRWYRATPKGPGLRFFLEGPSVVTFRPDGVTVELIDWRHGQALFLHPLLGDWHVIQGSHGYALVRLRQIP